MLIKILYCCNYIKDYKEQTEDDVFKAWDELYDGEWYIAIPPITNNPGEPEEFNEYCYAMSYRYLFTGHGYSINECMFGLKYLLILCILMMLGGYFTMRRANILPKAQ